MPTSALPSASEDLKQQVRDWLSRMTPGPCPEQSRFAVTLTFDQRKMLKCSASGMLTAAEALHFAKTSFTRFRMSLDRKILKSAASRHGKELVYVPVIEGQNPGEVIHYHCVIVAPAWLTLDHMSTAVKDAWMSTGLAGFEIDVQPMRDDGWLAYMSKRAWNVNQDCVDIDNVRLGTPPERC